MPGNSTRVVERDDTESALVVLRSGRRLSELGRFSPRASMPQVVCTTLNMSSAAANGVQITRKKRKFWPSHCRSFKADSELVLKPRAIGMINFSMNPSLGALFVSKHASVSQTGG